jgi:transposase-like protein/ssDNA-binding Zn-finger/Zn-ribbon topoisomerase 1
MNGIMNYLLVYIQYLERNISILLQLLARFIPLRQMAYDDSHSPEHQKFKTDKLPDIIKFEKQDYESLLAEYQQQHGKPIKPIIRKNGREIPDDIFCPCCNAPHHFLYDNNGGRGEYRCKVCRQTFSSGINATAPVVLACPYCGKTLQPKRDRKHFTVHTCTNQKCSYYIANLKKLPHDLPADKRSAYKLHYVYREFHINFFGINLNSLPDNASSLMFTKHNSYVVGLSLTYHINLSLSLRKTAQALKDIHNISISHTTIANYAHTAACVIKPFVDNYPYHRSDTFIGDETYIKVRGVKAFVWFVMDAVSRSVIGYRVSADRAVGSCILAMRLAFGRLKKLPDNFKFIADGYSAYPLAAQQFELRQDDPLAFNITPVIGLTNSDAVSKQYRQYKQLIERLNRTYKFSYRVSCGYDNHDGANYAVSLWVAYYNFLRPHSSFGSYGHYQTLNPLQELAAADNMPAKWQILLRLGQDTILQLQQAS